MSRDVVSDDEFCFVHAADLHLDSPFKGIGEVSPPVAEALREASLLAFDRLVQLCLDERAAFLLVAGDVYDGAERGIRAQLRFRDGLARLSEAGIHTFVVHGNHDPIGTGWSAVGTWPALVTVFPATEVGVAVVEREGRVLARVQGISYPRREVRENLALRFGGPEGAGLQIGLLHCNVTGAGEGHADYSPCSLEDLARSGLDYWALGHVHTARVLSGRPHGDEPWVVYPGNLQGRTSGEADRGPKGAVVVRVGGGRVASVEPVACDMIRYAAAEVDISTVTSVAEVLDLLQEAASGGKAEAEGRSVVLRARLVGRSDAHAALRRPGALEGVLAALRDGFSAAQPWCWWDRLVDASRPRLDLEELRAGSDFNADLVRMADSILGACSAPGLGLGIEAELPHGLLDDITGGLPRGLRDRVLTGAGSAAELLQDGLANALDSLGAGEPSDDRSPLLTSVRGPS